VLKIHVFSWCLLINKVNMFTVICTFLLGPFLTMLFIWYKMLSHMCGRGYGLAATSVLLVWRWRQCCWCCGDVSAAGVAVTSVLLVLRWRQCCLCCGDVSAACVAVTSVLLVWRWRQCCWCYGDVSAAGVAVTSVLLVWRWRQCCWSRITKHDALFLKINAHIFIF